MMPVGSKKMLKKTIEKIFRKNKTPIVIGGSGLYIKALVDGIFDTAEKDEEYRKELQQNKKRFWK